MRLSQEKVFAFQRIVWNYYRKHGRAFPWRKTRDPYAILVSEVMLQQTQAERVVPFFKKWMQQFPTVQSLARAPLKKVLRAWSGLGYNRRALNLKRAAEKIVKEHGGKFPKTIPEIDALPGVGPYTAGAIAAFAFNTPSAFIETNIRTVYLHFFFKNKREVRDDEILRMVQKTLPTPSLISPSKEGEKVRIRDWYNALMDYGGMLKKTKGNMNTRSAHYAKQSKFRGSRRELRGEILRKATRKISVHPREFFLESFPVAAIFSELTREGFLKRKGSSFTLA
jgi:A/G-specific adenine glycosylase